MFERWTLTEIVAVGAAALAVAYMMFEVSRRQRHLREVVNLIEGRDAVLTRELEELVSSGALQRYRVSAVR
jgi:hypothetical protein